ncbi:MAG: hypothetical protein R3D67_03395 [Hyphomicrobiaceae bacterium]
MIAGPILPFATDRRELAAQMCHLLAHGIEDPDIPLEQLGKVAREIALFLLSGQAVDGTHEGPPHLEVIEGGRR